MIPLVIPILALVCTFLAALIPGLVALGVTLNKISVLVERVTDLKKDYELNAEKFGRRLEKLERAKEVEDRVRRITRGEMPALVEPEESGKQET